MNHIPTAESQIIFLKKIQSLFDDSSFNATYKYALLITLTDLAIEYGDESGQPLTLQSHIIAKRFAEIYWPQTRHFSTGLEGTKPGVLIQNKGNQAEIITTLLAMQNESGIDDFSKIVHEKIWGKHINRIIRTLWENPVFYLQDEKDQFIYEYPKNRTELTLTAQSNYCLRLFSEFIIQYARQGWINHIKQNKRNQDIVGKKDDLESFLFGSNRSHIAKLTPLLYEFQNGKCFYCEKSASKSSDVDHFIPWKKYPRDLAQNFVLSCPTCNRSKSDTLAAKIHLDKWLTTIVGSDERSDSISKMGFISDKICTLKVAHWAYHSASISNGLAWHRKNAFDTINSNYLENISV